MKVLQHRASIRLRFDLYIKRSTLLRRSALLRARSKKIKHSKSYFKHNRSLANYIRNLKKIRVAESSHKDNMTIAMVRIMQAYIQELRSHISNLISDLRLISRDQHLLHALQPILVEVVSGCCYNYNGLLRYGNYTVQIICKNFPSLLIKLLEALENVGLSVSDATIDIRTQNSSCKNTSIPNIFIFNAELIPAYNTTFTITALMVPHHHWTPQELRRFILTTLHSIGTLHQSLAI